MDDETNERNESRPCGMRRIWLALVAASVALASCGGSSAEFPDHFTGVQVIPDGMYSTGNSYTIEAGTVVLNDVVTVVNGTDFRVRVDEVELVGNDPPFELLGAWLDTPGRLADPEWRGWADHSTEEVRAAGVPELAGHVMEPGEETKLVLALRVTPNDQHRSFFRSLRLSFSTPLGRTVNPIPFRFAVCHGPEGSAPCPI